MKDRVTDELSLASNRRTPIDAATTVVLAYIAAIAVAEAISVFIGVIPGTLGHAILIPTMLSHYGLSEARYRRVLPVLALVPLLRILSLVMPIQQLPQIYWHALVGLPLLIAAVLAAHLLGLSRAMLGLNLYARPLQALIALSGVPLSMAAFFILRPDPLIGEVSGSTIMIGAAILTIFAGFTEEFIFRGLLQQVVGEVFDGRAATLYSTILFAIMYIGSLSLSYVLFIALVGLFFAYCVNKSGSLWGVVLAHSIMNVGMVFVWPFIVNAPG